jgi:DNA-binding NarL/FixJ family response regulator
MAWRRPAAGEHAVLVVDAQAVTAVRPVVAAARQRIALQAQAVARAGDDALGGRLGDGLLHLGQLGRVQQPAAEERPEEPVQVAGGAEPDLAVVGESPDGERAVSDASALQPDVVVMDIRMPRMDGIQAARQIAARISETRVLILTTFDIDQHILDAIRAGASGFLVKDEAPDALVSAIRVIAAGDAILAPSVTRRLLDRFAHLAPASQPEPAYLTALTSRERDVLQLIGQGLSNAEIAAALFVAEGTVKTHVRHLLDKLNLRDRVQAVVFAYESGLITPRNPAGPAGD